MDNTLHYSTEQLVDFLEGRLDPLSSAELSKHLESGCQECNASKVYFERIFSAIQTLHWKSPSASAHKKVIRAFSVKYPTKAKSNLFPKLRPVFIGFTVLALIIFAFLFILKPGVVYAGHIEDMSGQVEMLDNSTGTWKPVTPGQSIPINATIRTLSDAHVTISFPGGEQTTLTSQSEVHLLSLAKSQGSWEISLEQVSGQTENQTSQNTHSFTVRTLAGLANSQNGHFIMVIAPDGSVITRVLEGEVEANSHSQRSIIHTGETSLFPVPQTSVESPEDTETEIEPSLTPSLEPSQTASSTIEPTKTPKNNGNKKQTITPTVGGSNPESTTASPGNSGSAGNNSNNADVNCSPGNSNGHGNSGNANNSSNACH